MIHQHNILCTNRSTKCNLLWFFAGEGELVGLCGLHRDYVTDDDNSRKMYPWMAFIKIQVNVSAFHLKIQCVGFCGYLAAWLQIATFQHCDY